MHSLLGIVLVLSFLAAGVTALDTAESISTAGKVYIASTTYDPPVFFPGDTGTATYVVTNGNNDTVIFVNHATLIDKNIRLQSKTYDTSVSIGPGQSHTFTFSVSADGNEGMYYPQFSLSFFGAGSLYSQKMVQIDSTPLILSVMDKPDAFAAGKKKTLNLQVANPRKNNVTNVVLDISGVGLSSTPSEVFIGNLGAGEKAFVNFSVTPSQPTTAILTLNYDNGDNPHVVTADIPVEFGVDKKLANPVISNVQVKMDQGIYHVTGDVNNAGLETANTVMVTSLEPAVPQDPYKSYVVGALKPDDFGSFEVTFSAVNTTSVPLQLAYKDMDGNIYNTEQNVKIAATTAATSQSNPPGVFLVIGIVAAILLVFVGGWVVYLRRNRK